MKISWRLLEDVLKTSWRCLEDVFATRLEDVWPRRLLKTKTKDVFQMSSRRLHQDECLLGRHSDGVFFFLKYIFLQFLHKTTTLWTEFGLKTVSCLVFQFVQFWKRFRCVFNNTGDFFGISLFLGYCNFKFLYNKVFIYQCLLLKVVSLQVLDKETFPYTQFGLKTVFICLSNLRNFETDLVPSCIKQETCNKLASFWGTVFSIF